MLEKQIEKKVCDHARSLGFLVYKFTSPQRAAVPDRLLISPNGFVFFIEFKACGKRPTPAQVREHVRLKTNKAIIHVIDNVDAGNQLIESYVADLSWMS